MGISAQPSSSKQRSPRPPEVSRCRGGGDPPDRGADHRAAGTTQIRSLCEALPPESATLIAEQLRDIATTSDRALSVGLVVSVLGTLFTASGGVADLIKAINLAYDEEETRGFARLRALALLLTLGAIVFMVVSVGLVAVLPVVLDQIGLGGVGQAVVGVLRWVGLLVFVTGALAVLYRFAPDRDDPRFS